MAVPTETVYGLGADAENEAAVRRIFEVKGRPGDHPLIVHVAGIEGLSGWLDERDATLVRSVRAARRPPAGPARSRCSCGAGPGCSTPSPVAARRWASGRPAHPLAQELLTRFGGGVAAPSANRFGRVSPTTAQHVLDDIGELLDAERDAVLDGGPSPIGVESTIIDLTVWPPQLLRAGAIGADDIARVLAHGSRPAPRAEPRERHARGPLRAALHRGARRRRRRRCGARA